MLEKEKQMIYKEGDPGEEGGGYPDPGPDPEIGGDGPY